jgi:hypothetical protein
MATEALTAQQVTRDGAEVNLQAVTAADGFTFPNDGHTILYVVNDAVALVLTFTIQQTLDGQSATRAETIADAESWVIGPFPPALYNDADGLVTCTPGADLAAGIAVIRI